MRVTDYELFDVPPRWKFLKIETSDGYVGWGEPSLSRNAGTVGTAVGELMESALVGEDPLSIEDHWQRLYRGGFYRGGPVLMSAIAGIDQALWDIKGKHFGAPVHELLGGPTRSRVRLYQHVHGDSPADVRRATTEAIDAGFTAVKTTPTEAVERVDSPAVVRAAYEYVAAIREAAGDAADVALDFHGRLSKPMAKRLAVALEEFDPLFYEEPVLPEHADAFPEIVARTSTPIATGERIHSRWGFKALFEAQSIDVAQPDLSHAGGITEVKKIADMAEAYDVALAPHCPLGPVSLAACLQIDGCSPNALVQEQVLHRTDGWREYLSDPGVFDHDDGYVDLPRRPGLGLVVDEDAVDDRSISVGENEVTWPDRPRWRHDDGSVAEW